MNIPVKTYKMSNVCYVFSTRLNCFGNYIKVYQLLCETANRNLKKYITVNNVHTVIEGTKNSSYKNIINKSFLALADGKPLTIYAKLKGHKNATRIFGPTLFEKTLDWGQKDDIKHFFLGGSEDTLHKMNEVITSKFPKAQITGYFSPPYKIKFSKEENDQFIEMMNNSNADIFWIGLGAPKQEIWMYENYEKLNKGIMIGIGAGFDYCAGTTKHAPEWMKNYALEWLYRLIQEPKRLWKRYLVTNSLFILYVIFELFHIKKFDIKKEG